MGKKDELNRLKSDLVVYLLRTILYVSQYLIFILFFSKISTSLLSLTRVSVFVAFIFFVSIILLSPVYGNFEIGVKKSKPIIYSTVVSVIFADLIAVVGLFLISVGAHNFKSSVIMSLAMFMLTIITQVIVIIALTYYGNSIYFRMNPPVNTLIIYKDKVLKNKIQSYVESYKKQYKLVDVVENLDNSKVDISDVGNIFILGMDSDYNNKMVENCYYESKSVYFDANMHDVLLGKNRTIVYDDVLMVEYTTRKLTLYQQFVKRFIDIVFSIIFIILTSPIMLGVALAIKMDDGGPVFYLQERISKDAKVFKIIKFRSMKLNSGSRPASQNDDRITKVGHIIRKFRVDELPQFINILKGDMGVVGPRPESIPVMENILEEHPKFVYRLKVKAGLTGYAQIFGKYNTTPDQKLLMDLKYIETYSLLNDIKLMLQTVNVFSKSDSTEGFDL